MKDQRYKRPERLSDSVEVIQYGRPGPKVRNTYNGATYRVQPEPQRYQAGNIPAETLKALLEAIQGTDWYKFILAKMKEAAQPKPAQANVPEVRPQDQRPEQLDAYQPHYFSEPKEETPADKLKAARAAYSRACETGREPLRYSQESAQVARERFERKQETLNQWQHEYAQFQEDSREVADKALQLAQRKGISYEDALERCGGSLPSHIPPAHVV